MRTRMLLLSLLVALVASGCFRVHLDVEVNDDGSGRVAGLAALNVKAVEGFAGALAGDQGADELCAQFEEDQGLNDPSIDQAKPYNADGWCGVEFSDTFAADEFDQAVSQIATDGAVLRRDGDGWYFELPLNTDEMSGDLSDGSAFPGFGDLLGDAEYIVRVKLPGKQVDYNADFIDNQGFAVWEIDITNPPTEPLRLRTEPGETIIGSKAAPGTRGDGGGGNTLVVVLVVVALLAAVGLGAWFVLQRKGSTAHGAPAPPTDLVPPGDPLVPLDSGPVPAVSHLPPPPVADATGRPVDLSGTSTADVLPEPQVPPTDGAGADPSGS